ncbi:anhydro-N-acetylmuramic acid kinase [Paenibacillus sp.]|uniref:anhydro-N-acetylmuramic acid kinase n=1 Tax=Paenibacillus sp. TaxID=58172 RepID=UPI00281108E6|nr:anhydro-N-acetylmuramic acid kinase [Paenibacillus sp.]
MIGAYAAKPSRLVVGLMSGTSLDGVDAAVVRLSGCGLATNMELVRYESRPYDDETRERLKDLCTVERSDVAAVCGMNFKLASLFADVAIDAVAGAGLSMGDIDLIASHGQTVWHIPSDTPGEPFLPRSTLQIGDLSVLAKRTGALVVGDFRPADMAVGGQGAPLAPYGDFLLFRSETAGRLLQNVGGIGNCAALPAAARPEDVFAFDTGPGNMVIDQAVFRLSNGARTYDDGGAWAASGRPDESLVDELMRHPYFDLPPPKSTGREVFGKAYTEAFLEAARARGLSDADIVATATAFTARTIAHAYRRDVFPRCEIGEVIVTGGGAHNRTLLRMLAELLPEQRVMNSRALGFDADAKEAIIFAMLGNDFLCGVANNLPSATGASRPTVMGKLALPW